MVKPQLSGPVTGAELLQLNKWELTQLVLRLGKDLDPTQLREHMRIVHQQYRRMGETARIAERKIGIRRPDPRL